MIPLIKLVLFATKKNVGMNLLDKFNCKKSLRVEWIENFSLIG